MSVRVYLHLKCSCGFYKMSRNVIKVARNFSTNIVFYDKFIVIQRNICLMILKLIYRLSLNPRVVACICKRYKYCSMCSPMASSTGISRYFCHKYVILHLFNVQECGVKQRDVCKRHSQPQNKWNTSKSSWKIKIKVTTGKVFLKWSRLRCISFIRDTRFKPDFVGLDNTSKCGNSHATRATISISTKWHLPKIYHGDRRHAVYRNIFVPKYRIITVMSSLSYIQVIVNAV